jgi:hypothetical protein
MYRCRRKSSSSFLPCPGGSGVRIAAPIIDAEVWKRVSALLSRPDIVARELDRLDGDDPVASDLEAVARSLGELGRKRGNLVAALAECDDKDSRTALTEALARLAEQIRGVETTRDELEGRRSSWSAARERIGDIQAWVQKVASRLSDASFQTRRDAIVWLGVTVRIFRTGSADRWIIEARLPLDEASSVQSGKAFNFAVAADGERGVSRAIGMLTSEIDRTLALIGRPTLADLDRTAVGLRRAASVAIPNP